MRSEVAIEILAAPELVFRLARDVTRWADLLPHYATSRAIRRNADDSLVCAFVARRALVSYLGLGVPVAWRARTWAERDTHRLRFRHLGGATDGMDVTWRIEATGTGSRIVIAHDFRPRMPGWAPLVDRLFTRPIARRTLTTFKAIAEAVSASGDETAAQSERAAAPNLPT